MKLYKLHMENLRDYLDEPSEKSNEQIYRLDKVVNEDMWEEFQIIYVSGIFASIDTRKMAERVGLVEDYRLIFSPVSSAVHGEWGAISQHNLMRCQNPLHKGHRIPWEDSNKELGAFHVDFALKLLTDLVDDYRNAFI